MKIRVSKWMGIHARCAGLLPWTTFCSVKECMNVFLPPPMRTGDLFFNRSLRGPFELPGYDMT